MVKGFYLQTARIGPSGLSRAAGIRVLYSSGDYTDVGQFEGRGEYVEWDAKQTLVKKVNLRPSNLVMDLHLMDTRIVGPDGYGQLIGGLGSGSSFPDADWDKIGNTPIHGTILGISGNIGEEGVELITSWTLNVQAKNSVLHDIKFNPSFEELKNEGNGDV